MSRTVLVVDESLASAQAACESLSLGGWDVVGVAVDGSEALGMAGKLTLDHAVLDIGLPDLAGFRAARHLTVGDGAPKVGLMSSRDWADLGRRIRDCGALRVLHKAEVDVDTIEAWVRSSGRPS